MAIAGEPFLVPCSRGLRKLVRRPDCRRCDQSFSLYWKVYSAISKMVWRIFVACLCQKLAACCIGTGDPRATLRIFQLSTATHCTVNWVKLKRVVNLLVWFQIPNINNYKPKQYSTHLFIFSWVVVEHFPVIFSYLYGARCSKTAYMLSPFSCSGQTYIPTVKEFNSYFFKWW